MRFRCWAVLCSHYQPLKPNSTPSLSSPPPPPKVDLKSMPAGAIWYDIDRDAPSALNLREWLLHITADPKRVLFNYVDTQPEFDKYKETGEFDERLGLKKPHQH